MPDEPLIYDAKLFLVGDPEDRTLRRVEVDVLIPKIMRQRAKDEKCLPEVEAFESCCKKYNLLMVVSCRKQNDAMKSCFMQWYNDEAFKKECTQTYLDDRAEFRRTGLTKKQRIKLAQTQQQTN
jgi:COX assembly protein 1